ncbi:MAG TPA: hypothetical protein VFY84_12640 [Jiangellales bacterium]|nr:hypothetical protein [Jiangellales bacterium]
MTHTATITLVRDEHGERCVVTHADDVIWIADELMDQARDPNRPRILGDLEIYADEIGFGVAGEGLGRLRYRLVGYDGEHGWHVAKRVESEENTDEP